MRIELRGLARTVACLAVALVPLGAAPIYHANYHGQATLISTPVTCSLSVTRNVEGDAVGWDASGCAMFHERLGWFQYPGFVAIDLPAGARILSADVRQWGSVEIERFSHTESVTPIDPGEPYEGESMYGNNGTVLLNGGASDCFWLFSCQFDFLVDETESVRRQVEYGWPGVFLPLWEVDVSFAHGYGRSEGGRNSVTVVTDGFRLTNSAAFWDVRIGYEVPIPEPATAPLVLVGGAGLLLLCRACITC